MSKTQDKFISSQGQILAMLVVSAILILALYYDNQADELAEIEQAAVESAQAMKREQPAVPYVEMLGFRLGEPLSKGDIEARFESRGYGGIDDVVLTNKGGEPRPLYTSESVTVREGIREYHYVHMRHHQVSGIGIATSYDNRDVCLKEYQAHFAALTAALGELGPTTTYQDGAKTQPFEHGEVFSVNQCLMDKGSNAMTLLKPRWELAIKADVPVFVLPLPSERRDPADTLGLRLTEPDTNRALQDVSFH